MCVCVCRSFFADFLYCRFSLVFFCLGSVWLWRRKGRKNNHFHSHHHHIIISASKCLVLLRHHLLYSCRLGNNGTSILSPTHTPKPRNQKGVVSTTTQNVPCVSILNDSFSFFHTLAGLCYNICIWGKEVPFSAVPFCYTRSLTLMNFLLGVLEFLITSIVTWCFVTVTTVLRDEIK